MAGQGLVQGLFDVIGGAFDVGGVHGLRVVDGPFVDEVAFGIDDVEGGRDLGVIEFADGAVFVEEDGGGSGTFLFLGLVGFLGAHVTLFAGSGGDDGKPDDIFAGVFLLEILHVIAVIVLLDKGAAVVKPLEDDELAFEVREVVGLAVGIGEGEGGGGLSDFRRGEGCADGEGEGDGGFGDDVHGCCFRVVRR